MRYAILVSGDGHLAEGLAHTAADGRDHALPAGSLLLGPLERLAEEVEVFIDEVADPSIRSWRYKLSVVDVCGIESELSLRHKTMHLTANVGTSAAPSRDYHNLVSASVRHF